MSRSTEEQDSAKSRGRPEGLPKRWSAFLDAVTDALERREGIEIRGFGTSALSR